MRMGGLGMRAVTLAAAAFAALGGAELSDAFRADIPLPDPVGDSGTALDITSVTISNEGGGYLRFTIPFPAAATLPAGMRVLLAFDTDENPKTSSAGAEYILSVDTATTFRLLHWTGTAFATVASPTVSLAYNKGVTVRLNKSDIGNPSGFNLFVETVDGKGGAGHYDLAPGATGWNYKIAAEKLVLKRFVVLSNGKPTAGKPFGLAVGLSVVKSGRTSTILPSKLSCRASVGGLPAATSVAVNTINGVKYGVCFTTPKSGTRGKTLSVQITATSTAFAPPARLSKTYNFKIS